jgi:hypothetical protein
VRFPVPTLPLEESGRRELALVRRALREGLLTQIQIAEHYQRQPPTVSNWIAGRKTPPRGLLFGVLACLRKHPDRQALILEWLAEDVGAGAVRSLAAERFRREVSAALSRYTVAAFGERAA